MALTHAASGTPVRIAPLGAALSEHRTSALLKAAQLELMRVVLPAGSTMREHQAPGEITVLCIEGLIDFSTPAATHRLQAGDLIHLPAHEPHALHAVADASALVTICLAAG